jgi:hypothetical protein
MLPFFISLPVYIENYNIYKLRFYHRERSYQMKIKEHPAIYYNLIIISVLIPISLILFLLDHFNVLPKLEEPILFLGFSSAIGSVMTLIYIVGYTILWFFLKDVELK